MKRSPPIGSLGNFFFGWTKVEKLIDSEVKAIGWFRRGIAPWLDLIQLEKYDRTTVKSYHRFGSLVVGIGSIILAFLIPLLLS